MKKTKKVEAFALLQSDMSVAIAFNHAHNVFQPRVYSTENAAIKVSETVVTGAEPLKVIPCIITYEIPTK